MTLTESSSKHPKDALIVFLLLTLAYVYFYHDAAWNGNSRLALVFAVVREGRLTIDSFHDQPGIDTGDKALYNGHYYSDKAIGTALAGSVAYLPIYGLARLRGQHFYFWVEKYLLTFLVIVIPSAFAGSLMYRLCVYITKSRVRAYVATAAITLGTMIFPYSAIYYGHQLAAVYLFVAFYLIFRLRAAPAFRKGRMFLVGLLLGLALITEYTTAVVVLPLVAYYFHTLWIKRASLFGDAAEESEAEESRKTARRRGVAAVALPALGGTLPLLLMFAYNYACFGSPFSLAYEHMENPLFKEGMSRGLMGVRWPRIDALFYITLHPSYGIFWQSPVLIMSVVGLRYMLRDKTYRPEALVAIFALAAYLFVNAGYYMWWGGWSFGPRHLIPALPFLCLPLLFVPARAFLLTVALALVSIFQMFVVTATVIDVPDTHVPRLRELGFFEHTPIYGFCWPRFVSGELSLNLGVFFGLSGLATLLPLALAYLCIIGLFYFRHRSARANQISTV